MKDEMELAIVKIEHKIIPAFGDLERERERERERENAS